MHALRSPVGHALRQSGSPAVRQGCVKSGCAQPSADPPRRGLEPCPVTGGTYPARIVCGFTVDRSAIDPQGCCVIGTSAGMFSMSSDPRRPVVEWIAADILPHEALVRNWLIRRWGHAMDVDDVIQEAYCRLSELESIDHIRNGRAYFFTTVQAVAVDLLRAAKVANATRMTEIEWEYVIDEGPTPERVAEGQEALLQLQGLLSQLSSTCRQVIELRRLHGLSQAETARRLGVSENVVENHVTRGLKRLLRAMTEKSETEQGQGRSGWKHPATQIRWTSAQPDGPRALRMDK
jgi:RNA polymerase sigma factor (sigma-70 family)